MMAFAVFSVIAAIIYSPFLGVQKFLTITEPQADIYRKARITMTRIIEDLESAYYNPLQKVSPDDEVLPFTGLDQEIDGRSADTIRFISKAHIDFDGAGEVPDMTLISYEILKSDRDDSLMILRGDTPLFLGNEQEETEGQLLCDGLLSVNFKYHDAEDNESDNWDMSTDDSGDLLPRLVDIVLEFRDVSGERNSIKFMTSVALPLAGDSDDDGR